MWVRSIILTPSAQSPAEQPPVDFHTWGWNSCHVYKAPWAKRQPTSAFQDFAHRSHPSLPSHPLLCHKDFWSDCPSLRSQCSSRHLLGKFNSYTASSRKLLWPSIPGKLLIFFSFLKLHLFPENLSRFVNGRSLYYYPINVCLTYWTPWTLRPFEFFLCWNSQDLAQCSSQ